MKVKENKFVLILLVTITVVSLVVAVIMEKFNQRFYSSIFQNIFAGMVTGCVLASLSAYKSRRKLEILMYKTAYKTIFDCNTEFISNKNYNNQLSDYNSLFESIYDKMSYLVFIIDYIEKYTNEKLIGGELRKKFLEKFSSDTEKKREEYMELRDNLLNNKYKTQKELFNLVKNYEIEILQLNAKIAEEINNCDRIIYQIDQGLI